MVSPACLLFLTLVATFANAQVTSQKPLTKNVTYYSNDPAIEYIADCVEDTASACHGAWWTEYNSKYSNGRVKVTGNPDSKFSHGESYFTFTVKGTGFYVYQWINKTSGTQKRVFNYKGFNDRGDQVNVADPKDWPYPVNEEATLTLVWAETGLDPGTYSMGLAHVTNSDFESYLVLDRIVVEELVEDSPAPPSKDHSNRGRIIGGAVAGTFLLFSAIALFIIYRRSKAAKARREAHAKLAASREVQCT
ncbi:hypothetical protein FRC03_004692 [Tulasnella sp. 419]|nr:hypothetical protein FRC03_004692 [Tulasnella sp. 419]